jgi:hypothetical protein
MRGGLGPRRVRHAGARGRMTSLNQENRMTITTRRYLLRANAIFLLAAGTGGPCASTALHWLFVALHLIAIGTAIRSATSQA